MLTLCKFRAGWTLVELLVVLSIVGALFTLTLPAWQTPLERSMALARQQLLHETLAHVQLQLSWSENQEQNLRVEDICSGFYQQRLERFEQAGLSIHCSLQGNNVISVKGTGAFETLEIANIERGL